MTEQQKALPESDWRREAKERDGAQPAMQVQRLAVEDGRLIAGKDTVLKEGLIGLPLAAVYARAYYSKPYEKGKKTPTLPDCYSTASTKNFEGVSPEQNAPNIQAKYCDECPLGSWDKSGWVSGQKSPECGTRRNVIVKDTATGKIYRLSVPPTGVKAFDDYWQALTGPLAGNWVKITADGKIPAFEVAADLTFDEFKRFADPFIEEAEKLLRAPINYEAAAKAEAEAAGGGSEEAITPGKAPDAPKAKPRF